MLAALANRGVEVTLVTRKQTFQEHIEYDDSLKKMLKIYLFTTPRHEKMYIADDRILIDSTWNLTLSSSSTNRFEIKIVDPQSAAHIKSQILLNSERV